MSGDVHVVRPAAIVTRSKAAKGIETIGSFPITQWVANVRVTRSKAAKGIETRERVEVGRVEPEICRHEIKGREGN